MTLMQHLHQLAAVLAFKQKRALDSSGGGGGGDGAAEGAAATPPHEAAPAAAGAGGGGTRPQFGARRLEDEGAVFSENAWDDVELGPEQVAKAREAVAAQAKHPVDDRKHDEVVHAGGEHWDAFYQQHENRFFKDRHWLLTEFAELAAGGAPPLPPPRVAPRDATPRWECSAGATRRVLEVGCGAGNTIFPLLDADADPGFFVYGCDFAPSAVEIVRTHALFDPNRCHAFVCDVSTEDLGLPPGSLDAVVLIFVLSAINPDRLESTVARLARALKPGGLLLMRDYGRFDLAQTRLGRGRYLAENFYIRGDKTKVHFFSREEVRALMAEAGLEEVQNAYDNRLIVNRSTQSKMHRVWLQCKYRRPTGVARPAPAD